jgi:hypothetical protein
MMSPEFRVPGIPGIAPGIPELSGGQRGTSSQEIRRQVASARQVQARRLNGSPTR